MNVLLNFPKISCTISVMLLSFSPLGHTLGSRSEYTKVCNLPTFTSIPCISSIHCLHHVADIRTFLWTCLGTQKILHHIFTRSHSYLSQAILIYETCSLVLLAVFKQTWMLIRDSRFLIYIFTNSITWTRQTSSTAWHLMIQLVYGKRDRELKSIWNG